MKKSKQGWITEKTCTDKKNKQQVAGKLRSHKKKEWIILYWGHKEHWGSDATSCCYCYCCSSSLEVLGVGSNEVHHMVLQISQRFIIWTSLLHLEETWATTELSSLVSGLHDCVLQGFLDVAAVPEQGLGYKEPAMMNSTITEDGSVDFKGRPADKSTTGGWKTAPFIFGMLRVNAFFEQHLLDVQFSSDVVVCASSLHACLFTYCCKCAATAMFEMIVNLGIAFNLNSYLSGPMHIPIKRASQYTTSYWGTSFMTSLIGGFISDTYLGRFWTSVLAAVIELLVKSNKPIISLCCLSLLDTSWMAQLQSEIVNGILEHHHLLPSTVSWSACCFTLSFSWNWQEQLQDFLVLNLCGFWVQGIVLVVISATVPSLKPNCPQTDFSCPPFTGTKGYSVFMVGLYIIGLGTGMLRPCLAAFGADQFDLDDPQESKKIRSYFNWLFFSISVGAIIAIIAVIYVAENVSWPWGFGMVGFAMLCSTLSFLAGIFLYRHQTAKGSPLTRMAQVLVASLRKRKVAAPADSGALFEVNDTENNVPAEVEPTLKRHHSLPHTKGMQ